MSTAPARLSRRVALAAVVAALSLTGAAADLSVDAPSASAAVAVATAPSSASTSSTDFWGRRCWWRHGRRYCRWAATS
jgi:hypothetical protein